jgi:hypothetical protein
MESTVYRVLWGALGEHEQDELRRVAGSSAAASPELTASIREAEQCLDIGGLPVGEVIVDADRPLIDPGFLSWVQSH